MIILYFIFSLLVNVIGIFFLTLPINISVSITYLISEIPFDDVIFLSTEKFYTNQTEHDRLSDFLKVPRIGMSNLYENTTLYRDNTITYEDIEIAKEKLLPSIEIYRQL